MKSLFDYISEAYSKGYSKEEIVNLFLKKGYSKKEIESCFEKIKIDKSSGETNYQDISYWDKIKLLISKPKGFFEKVRDKNILKSLALFSITSAVIFFISITFSFAFSFLLDNFYSFSLTMILFRLIIFILLIGATFVFSGIQHLFVIIFNGKGNYCDTYNAYVYSLIPAVIISIVPFFGFFGFIYSIILSTFGFSKYHELSTGKAVFIALIPLIILSLLIILLFFSLYFFKTY